MTHVLTDFGDGFAVGKVTALGARLHVLSLPMRFHPGHVNAYLFEDDDGLTLVDTGNLGLDNQALWQGVLDSPLGRKGVRRVLLTHGHPDHCGQAEWLCHTTGAELWLTAPELDAIRRLWRGAPLHYAQVKPFFLQWGMPDDQFPAVQRLLDSFRFGTSDLVDASVRLIEDGEVLTLGGQPWQVKCGYGHSPANATLWQRDSGLLITGDHLLPRISPNISLWWGSTPDPLGEYLTSIQTFHGLGDVVGLPAHGGPFGDLDDRVRLLTRFHQKRVQRALAFCQDEPRTAFECIHAVLGKVDSGGLIALIAGQAFAILAFLEQAGWVQRQPGEVFRFQTVPGAGELMQRWFAAL